MGTFIYKTVSAKATGSYSQGHHNQFTDSYIYSIWKLDFCCWYNIVVRELKTMTYKDQWNRTEVPESGKERTIEWNGGKRDEIQAWEQLVV